MMKASQNSETRENGVNTQQNEEFLFRAPRHLKNIWMQLQYWFLDENGFIDIS
jgi:hypothetical protein